MGRRLCWTLWDKSGRRWGLWETNVSRLRIGEERQAGSEDDVRYGDEDGKQDSTLIQHYLTGSTKVQGPDPYAQDWLRFKPEDPSSPPLRPQGAPRPQPFRAGAFAHAFWQVRRFHRPRCEQQEEGRDHR